MEFHETGVSIYSFNSMSPQTDLTYTRQAVLNDGNWHHVVFNYDFTTGAVTLYLDTIKHADGMSQVMPNTTYK